jgi:hypothetical protein
MANAQCNVAVSVDERRGYVGTHPKLRSPVTALSLGGLRRRIGIPLLPEVDVDIRPELDRGARLEYGTNPPPEKLPKSRRLCSRTR